MRRRSNPKTGVNKPFENVSGQRRIQNLFQGRAPIFVTFQTFFFFGRVTVILSNLSTKNDSRGFGGMLPPKMFENLHTEMAI